MPIDKLSVVLAMIIAVTLSEERISSWQQRGNDHWIGRILVALVRIWYADQPL